MNKLSRLGGGCSNHLRGCHFSTEVLLEVGTAELTSEVVAGEVVMHKHFLQRYGHVVILDAAVDVNYGEEVGAFWLSQLVNLDEQVVGQQSLVKHIHRGLRVDAEFLLEVVDEQPEKVG